MKANACMLPRVMCERCIGLCHKNDLKMKTIGTSCILYTSGYFLIYDDEYGCVHYDDDDHALYNIRGFADLQTSGYEQLA